jgi:2-polyprenyl-3-methyl-5-hydroxy-6-metoxy-1,4-benzoquinol methylase
VRFIEADVRTLSVDTHGMFDVVLCLGILHHIPREDLPRFIENVSAVCRDLLVAKTFVSLRSAEAIEYARWRGGRSPRRSRSIA